MSQFEEELKNDCIRVLQQLTSKGLKNHVCSDFFVHQIRHAPVVQQLERKTQVVHAQLSIPLSSVCVSLSKLHYGVKRIICELHRTSFVSSRQMYSTRFCWTETSAQHPSCVKIHENSWQASINALPKTSAIVKDRCLNEVLSLWDEATRGKKMLPWKDECKVRRADVRVQR